MTQTNDNPVPENGAADVVGKKAKNKAFEATRWLIGLAAAVSVASPIGSYYLTQERVANATRMNDAQQVSIQELERFKAHSEDTMARMQRHMDDKSIHITDDQIRLAIQTALEPIRSGLANLQAQIPLQQRQLDRIERNVDRLVDRNNPNKQ